MAGAGGDSFCYFILLDSLAQPITMGFAASLRMYIHAKHAFGRTKEIFGEMGCWDLFLQHLLLGGWSYPALPSIFRELSTWPIILAGVLVLVAVYATVLGLKKEDSGLDAKQ